MVFIAPEHLYHLKVFHPCFPSREQYASLFYNLADREAAWKRLCKQEPRKSLWLRKAWSSQKIRQQEK